MVVNIACNELLRKLVPDRKTAGELIFCGLGWGVLATPDCWKDSRLRRTLGGGKSRCKCHRSPQDNYLRQGMEFGVPSTLCYGPEHDAGPDVDGEPGSRSCLVHCALEEVIHICKGSSRCPDHDVDGALGSLAVVNHTFLEEASRVCDDTSHVPEYAIDGASGPLPYLRELRRLEKVRRVYDDRSRSPEHHMDGAPNSLP